MKWLTADRSPVVETGLDWSLCAFLLVSAVTNHLTRSAPSSDSMKGSAVLAATGGLLLLSRIVTPSPPPDRDAPARAPLQSTVSRHGLVRTAATGAALMSGTLGLSFIAVDPIPMPPVVQLSLLVTGLIGWMQVIVHVPSVFRRERELRAQKLVWEPMSASVSDPGGATWEVPTAAGDAIVVDRQGLRLHLRHLFGRRPWFVPFAYICAPGDGPSDSLGFDDARFGWLRMAFPAPIVGGEASRPRADPVTVHFVHPLAAPPLRLGAVLGHSMGFARCRRHLVSGVSVVERRPGELAAAIAWGRDAREEPEPLTWGRIVSDVNAPAHGFPSALGCLATVIGWLLLAVLSATGVVAMMRGSYETPVGTLLLGSGIGASAGLGLGAALQATLGRVARSRLIVDPFVVDYLQASGRPPTSPSEPG